MMHVVITRSCSIILLTISILLPSTAKAWHWSLLNGWDFDSYAECMDYYAKNPATSGCSYGVMTSCHPAYTSEQMCAVKKAEEDDDRRKQEEAFRLIVS